MTTTLPEGATDQAQDAAKPKSHRPALSKKAIVLGVGAAVVALALARWQPWRQAENAQQVFVSGRIEADETNIQARNGGQILSINVREGDAVKVGQTLVQIQADEVQAQVDRSTADMTTAQARASQTQSDLNSAKERVMRAEARVDELDARIQEANLNLQQSQGETSGQIGQANAGVAAAKSQLAQAQAQVIQAQAQIREAQAAAKLALTNRDRYRSLVQQGAINQQQFDQVQTTLETAQANVDTAQANLAARQAAMAATQEQLNAAQEVLVQAQSKGLNPAIRDTQINALTQQRQQAIADLNAAKADVQSFSAKANQAQSDVKSFQARQQEAKANLAYSQIASPIAGVVQSRFVEPGAVVTPQKTILTLINPDTVYLRGYIPDREIGKVRVGMKAKIFLDSSPQQPLSGRIQSIDPNASFTPENIYFKQDRIKQVFGVKIAIENGQGFAKRGMPADAEISLQGD
jgi:HlyD family secretion protein